MDKQTFSEAVRRMERSLYRVAMSYTGNVPDAAERGAGGAAARMEPARYPARRALLRYVAHARCDQTRARHCCAGGGACCPWRSRPNSARPSHPGADVALYEALFSLPPKYRVPLILTCLDGYTMRETAHIAGRAGRHGEGAVTPRTPTAQGETGRGGNRRCVKKIWTAPLAIRRPRSPGESIRHLHSWRTNPVAFRACARR